MEDGARGGAGSVRVGHKCDLLAPWECDLLELEARKGKLIDWRTGLLWTPVLHSVA